MQCATGLPACRRLTCAAPERRTKFPRPMNDDAVGAGCFPETLDQYVNSKALCGAANPGCSRLSAGSFRIARSRFLPQETFPTGIVCRSCERDNLSQPSGKNIETDPQNPRTVKHTVA